MLYIKKSLDNVRAEMEKNLERYIALSAAWEAVTIRTKKEGGEFQNIANAVDGGKVYKKTYMNGRELRVYCRNVPKNNMYIDDYIDLYTYTKTEDGKNWVELSAAELRKDIAKRSEYFAEQADETRKALETIEQDYKEYVAAIEKANEIAKRHGDRSATYYALYDVAK